jgi:hypothetical protein
MHKELLALALRSPAPVMLDAADYLLSEGESHLFSPSLEPAACRCMQHSQ